MLGQSVLRNNDIRSYRSYTRWAARDANEFSVKWVQVGLHQGSALSP